MDESGRGWRHGRRVVACTLGVALTATLAAAVASPRADVVPTAARVIVRGDARVLAAIERAGGSVVRDLALIDGSAASVPADRLGALRAAPGVWSVDVDRRLRVLDVATTDDPADTSGDPPVAPPDAVHDETVRAADLRAAARVDGSGVTVALVDTGVSAVPELTGRLVTVGDRPCVNLTADPSCGDKYGHGTFLAGIIAGTGARAGVAPGARILSLKVAGADGAADVSTVIAAVQYAVTFRQPLGIKVLNLSLGTDSTQDWRTDPLNYAVERAWRSGITVVVAVSNRGPDAGTVSKPADDPWVITVGAVEDRGTPSTSDDVVPSFSGRGPTAHGLAKPDVLAPGVRLVSLRAPGSSIERAVAGGVDAVYRRGSGTSMAAAVTSGVAALLLQRDPSMSPDRLKFALTAMASGPGVIDAIAASTAPAGVANGDLTVSDGRGSMSASRGSVRVTQDDGTVIGGEKTAQRKGWNRDAFVGAWDANAWGQLWGSSWYGSSWYGSSWYAFAQGSSWYGSSWYGSSWYGVWD